MSSIDKKRRSPADSLIDLTVDSDDEHDRKPAATRATPKYPKVKHEGFLPPTATVTPKFEDDGLEIVDKPAVAPTPFAAMPAVAEDGDDDVQMVGGKNILNLPHTRQDCTQIRFDSTTFDGSLCFKRETIETNKETCPQCYCYVCDKPATECENWFSATSEERGTNHCCANNADAFWRNRRNAVKNANGSMNASQDRDALDRDDSEDGDEYEHDRDEYEHRYNFCFFYDNDDDDDDDDDDANSEFVSRHPFAANLFPNFNSRTVKCRKCHNEYCLSGLSPRNPLYCEICGRIAQDSDLKEKATSQKHFKKESRETHLGTKTFEFTLETPDPRSMSPYRTNWIKADTTLPQWQFSEAEMDHDAFCVQIGPRPAPSDMHSILGRNRYPDHCRHQLRSTVTGLSEVGYQILSSLSMFYCIRSNIAASWDERARKGKFTVDVYLSSYVCGPDEVDQRTCFVGLWCGIFPLKPSDLSNRVMCSTDVAAKIHKKYPRMTCTKQERHDLEKELKAMVHDYRTSQEIATAKLKLLCSSGNRNQGHVCDDDTSLLGIFKRVYSQKILEFQSFPPDDCDIPNIFKIFGNGSPYTDEIVLGYGGAFFFNTFVRKRLDRSNDPSITSTLQRIENLGHDVVDYVAGLNCELLDFQRQSLKWALERETIPGGIQRLFWGRLPFDDSRAAKDLWYNPVTGHFRDAPPKLIRGGFIAEEMGLGKTIISLALILKNPAPAEPVSGTRISDIIGGLKEPWNKRAHDETSTAKAKRGSILSRGTLVICPVSLVGQWIDEAKSKLQDPGLIYPYYGQKRVRDAEILARNSIVVTTYQVIASDAAHHARKAGMGYCPPLEQIRWWRVICDEGHSLRDSQTQRSKAVLSIPGDHKWLVSGTPLNTSIADLTNQLKFLGIENPEVMMQAVSNNESRNHRRLSEFDTTKTCLLPAVLGSIMMRHTQKMKYRDTKMTLMQLPKKTERTLKVKFTGEEIAEYQKLETVAQDVYVKFRALYGSDITKHYLKISSILTRLRVACAGGKYPIDRDPLPEETDEDENEGAALKKIASKRPKEYSTFVFTSKFKVLIAELERIRDEDPSSKSLVFSQFGSSLQWLQDELPKHGFQYRTLTGRMSVDQCAKALHAFQSDPPTTIFLLSVRAGGVGINLTQANCVFMLEPCFNPALESQAIGRVHRLGQKREVHITRLIQEDSVESRILKFLARKFGSGNTNQAKNGGSNGAGNEEVGAARLQSVASCTAVIGNLVNDKADMMIDDFDLLFGAPRSDPIMKMVRMER